MLKRIKLEFKTISHFISLLYRYSANSGGGKVLAETIKLLLGLIVSGQWRSPGLNVKHCSLVLVWITLEYCQPLQVSLMSPS